MTLEDLIAEGQVVRGKCLRSIPQEDNVILMCASEYLTGEDYEKWIAKCVLYMEKNHKDSALYNRFLKASETAVGNGIEHYEKMMGILKAVKEFEA